MSSKTTSNMQLQKSPSSGSGNIGAYPKQNFTRGRHQNTRPRRRSTVSKYELHGGRMTVDPNPPEATYQPWMPLTVVHIGKTTDLHMSVRSLCSQIIKQVDPIGHALKPIDTSKPWSADECIMQIRLRSVRVWNVTGRMVTLSVDDFSDANKSLKDIDTLCGLVDTGSPTHVPAVGYKLPASHQNIVLRNDDVTNSAILFHCMVPSTDTMIIYTSVFYRFDGPAKVSIFDTTMTRMIRQISNDMRKVRLCTDKICEDTNSISKGRSTVERVIEGVTKTVEVVAIASAVSGDERDEEIRLRKLDKYLEALPDDMSIISSEH